MIDYIALIIGHGLLAYAFWHLFMRPGVDTDPLIEDIKAQMQSNRDLTSAAGRAAARRKTEQTPVASPTNSSGNDAKDMI